MRYPNRRILGSPFTAINLKPEIIDLYDLQIKIHKIYKSWCLYLNSTYAILGFLNTRGTDLKYSKYSKRVLNSLLVPNPLNTNIIKLSECLDSFKESELNSMYEINECHTRRSIDEAIYDLIPNLPNHNELRELINLEPTVQNRRNGR